MLVHANYVQKCATMSADCSGFFFKNQVDSLASVGDPISPQQQDVILEGLPQDYGLVISVN